MTTRELSADAILDQARAFLDYHRKVGGSWGLAFSRWARSKDFAPLDQAAISAVLAAALAGRAA